MRRHYARLLRCATAVVAMALIASCRDRLPERPSEEEILKAMHDDLSVSHKVADFMIKDHDGIELLAERLSKDPQAASQLLETMQRKGGAEKAIADACARVAERRPDGTGPPPAATTTAAQELQSQPAGGTQ